MTTVRRQIVEALQNALDEITVAAGYRNNLKRAVGGGGVWLFQATDSDEIRTTPWIQVSALGERTTQEGAYGHVLKELDVQLEVLHDIREDKEGWERIESVLADAEEVLLAQRAAGTILNVSGVRNIAIQSSAIRPVAEMDHLLSGTLLVVVQYRHSDTSLEAAL